MGAFKSPAPVKLFIGVLTSIADILPAVERKLSSVYGAIDSRSGQFPFEYTRYYNETMGHPIYRHFLGFETLIEPPSIADIKIVTNEMESQFATEWTQVPRPVNLDPGYIEESKLVLASTKNFYHRILIARNIYAEVTLHYERGAWRTLPWTFPDYASENYHSYFMSLRRLYRKQLNSSEF
jgi:hypothetical protein